MVYKTTAERPQKSRAAGPILGAVVRVYDVVANLALQCSPLNECFEIWFVVHPFAIEPETGLRAMSRARFMHIAPIEITIIARMAKPIKWLQPFQLGHELVSWHAVPVGAFTENNPEGKTSYATTKVLNNTMLPVTWAIEWFISRVI